MKASEVQQQVMEIISNAHAFNKQTKFLNIDCIWQDPIYGEPFSKLLASYIKTLPIFSEIKVIVGLDKVREPFGCIPLLPAICRDLSLPLVIWKEYGNIITGSPKLHGSTIQTGLLIVQDVIEHGLAPLRAAIDLHDQNRTPVGVISIADYARGTDDYIRRKFAQETGKEIFIDSIFTLEEFVQS